MQIKHLDKIKRIISRYTVVIGLERIAKAKYMSEANQGQQEL